MEILCIGAPKRKKEASLAINNSRAPEKMEMGGGEAHLFLARVRSMLPPDPGFIIVGGTAYNSNAAKAVALQVLPPPIIKEILPIPDSGGLE